MAFTGSIIERSVFGNKRIAAVSCTADALSGAVSTGLNVVSWVSIAPISMATAGVQIAINKNASGTATNGNVKVSGCTSGDTFYLVCYGT